MEWLMSAEVYRYILIGSVVYAGLILVGAFMAKAPYGKLGSERSGVNLSPDTTTMMENVPCVPFATRISSGKIKPRLP